MRCRICNTTALGEFAGICNECHWMAETERARSELDLVRLSFDECRCQRNIAQLEAIRYKHELAELRDAVGEYLEAVSRPDIYSDPGTNRAIAFETLRKAVAKGEK